MATADAPAGESSFDTQVSQIKIGIESQFTELIECLKRSKDRLLRELEEIHNKYKQENEKHRKSLSEIEKALKFNRENFESSPMRDIQSGIIKTLKQKQRELESGLRTQNILFEFDNTLQDRINRFGRITVVYSTNSCLPVVEYTNKSKPVVMAGSQGSGKGQFKNPFCIAVDYLTNNIFVADHGNNRVQVFRNDGRYMFQFGSDRMKSPVGIAIVMDRVLVSQYETGCLLVYNLRGNFIQQIGTHGSGDGQFTNPYGIAINLANGDIYVCDYSNSRAQIFSKDYTFKSKFGAGLLNSPVDIQLTSNAIFVLSHKQPFIYVFSYGLTQIQNISCDSIRKHLKGPIALIIDRACNFIISDYNNNSVIVFDNTGQVVHTLTEGITQPTGISTNSQGGIVVVGHNNRITIF